ncbi:MAG TPA: universal stress protein [Terriglobia bacterium]|nr:universal stress protein [Terriglobia bacterium]
MEEAKVMVALRDAETAGSLTKLGCQMASLMGTNLTALHVVEVAAGLPLDANEDVLDHPGKEVLSIARQIASNNFSMRICTKMLRARHPGEAIVAEAAGKGIELLIVGYHHNHRLAETLLGSTVQYVSHHAPCKVLVQIPPPKEHAKTVPLSTTAGETAETKIESDAA